MLSPPGLEPSKLSNAVKPNAIFLEPVGKLPSSLIVASVLSSSKTVNP